MKEKNNLKKTIIWFLISRIILFLFLIIKKDLSVFELYDSEHYIEIAKFGYTAPKLYAFFPLYPTIIKLLHYIIPSYQIAGALISNISSFLSIIILNKITNNNKFNTICIIFTPILAYTSMVYTESIFMLLTILGYYLYKKDKYILSAIIIGLSTLTRNSGIILWGSIGLDMLYRLFITKDKNIKFKNILIFGLISLSIGLTYPIFLYIKTGNFLEFITVQNEYWHRVGGTFIDGIIYDIKVMSFNPQDNLFLNIVIFIENWLSFILLLIIGIKIFKKDKVSSIYIIVSLIAFTISYRDINYWTTLSSISLFRYVLNLFPLYIYLFDDNKSKRSLITFMIFLTFSIFNAILIYGGLFLG
ncbi:MAG: hypothetical protein IJE89_00305 [Bacilli bacterium]|nr:hypothetical protein [Bacilli bacterium]MBQ9854522.1 hypothetical protein [Bacilli bacterium]